MSAVLASTAKEKTNFLIHKGWKSVKPPVKMGKKKEGIFLLPNHVPQKNISPEMWIQWEICLFAVILPMNSQELHLVLTICMELIFATI